MSSPNLANILSWGLLQFPALFTEFSTIVASLDAGNIICPSTLSNKPLGLYLDKLFSHLPLEFIDGRGWCKDKKSPISSISGYILNELLILKTIVQPSQLSPSQTLASRSAPAVMRDILTKFPELVEEIPGLLENMIGGGKVQLSGLENGEVAQLLGNFFDSLGFKQSDYDSEECSDDEAEDEDRGSRSLKPNDAVGHSSLCYMINVFRSAEKFGTLRSSKSSASKSSNDIGDINVRSNSSSSSSSSNMKRGDESHGQNDSDDVIDEGSGSDDDGSEGEAEAASSARIGPSMPTAAQLASAQDAAQVHYIYYTTCIISVLRLLCRIVVKYCCTICEK
jgi:hypothetical protein